MMKQILVVVFTVGFIINLSAQDTAVYEVKTNLFKLGEMQAVQTYNPLDQTNSYKLTSSFKLWSIYTIVYQLESIFRKGVLISSKAKITANNKTKHYCQVTKKDSFYIREIEDTIDTLEYSKIQSGITQLYFEPYQGPDSIFAELAGKYVPFKKLDDKKFLLANGKNQEFSFNQNRVEMITAPNSVLDFFIILK